MSRLKVSDRASEQEGSVELKLLDTDDRASVRLFHVQHNVVLPLHFDDLPNDFEFTPLAVDFVVSLSVIELFLPYVTVVTDLSCESPSEVLVSAQANAWHANERGSSHVTIAPNKLLQLPEAWNDRAQVRIS